MLELEHIKTNEAMSSGVSWTVGLIALLQASSPFAPAYRPAVQTRDADLHIGYAEIASTAASLDVTSSYEDELLSQQMAALFHRLITSQTPIEPEFGEVLYRKRRDMYTLF